MFIIFAGDERKNNGNNKTVKPQYHTRKFCFQPDKQMKSVWIKTKRETERERSNSHISILPTSKSFNTSNWLILLGCLYVCLRIRYKQDSHCTGSVKLKINKAFALCGNQKKISATSCSNVSWTWNEIFLFIVFNCSS